MRDIKFRAWDKINDEMYEYGTDKACYLWDDGCEMMGMSFISCQPNVVWQQYTGLKDKYNGEIYEGDIFQCRDHGGLNQFTPNSEDFTGIIVFKLGCFCIKYNGEYDVLTNWNYKGEIIGNIYENPAITK